MSPKNGPWAITLGLLVLASCTTAPPPIPAGEDPLRWRADIEAFDEAAGQVSPPSEAALFVGSSSIRLWDTLREDMAPLPVIQRGFGGSRLFDSIYWAERLVLAHDPAVIVMFSGTNDIKGKQPKSAARVLELFEEFVALIRRRGCDAPLVYIAISPSQARIEHLELVLEANEGVAALCRAHADLHFIDTASHLLDSGGEPDSRWFVEDGLHLNADGYALWTRHIKPVVARLLAE